MIVASPGKAAVRMLRNFFRAMRLRSAAQKYAGRLGPQLRKDYGVSEHYNSKQIERSALRAKLPANYIQFGYAAFMNEEAFKEAVPAGSSPTYEELKSILQQYARNGSNFGGSEPAAENSYAITGGNN
jgi:hypothetical protein